MKTNPSLQPIYKKRKTLKEAHALLIQIYHIRNPNPKKMKRKLEELESKNHDNFPAVMKIVKGYCEEKKKKKEEEETRPPREPRWSDEEMAIHLWRGVCRRKGVKIHEYVLATDYRNMTRGEIKLDRLWRKVYQQYAEEEAAAATSTTTTITT